MTSNTLYYPIPEGNHPAARNLIRLAQDQVEMWVPSGERAMGLEAGRYGPAGRIRSSCRDPASRTRTVTVRRPPSAARRPAS